MEETDNVEETKNVEEQPNKILTAGATGKAVTLGLTTCKVCMGVVRGGLQGRSSRADVETHWNVGKYVEIRTPNLVTGMTGEMAMANVVEGNVEGMTGGVVGLALPPPQEGRRRRCLPQIVLSEKMVSTFPQILNV